jgi:hypothetical protein
MLQFYKNNFADDRKGIFRYLIVGSKGGFCIPSTFNRYDTIIVNSAPITLIKRQTITPRAQRIALAAASMHELGHSMGIAPWTFQGNDNISYQQGERSKYVSTWGDYYSVMNYYYIWDMKLADYSDGSNGPPYDQNDWEHFYLPTFYIEANAIEDPSLELPGTNRLVYDVPDPLGDGWTLDENLTMDHLAMIRKMSYQENVNCDYRVYIENQTMNETSNMTIIRIYAKPDTGGTYSQWSLISMGLMDEGQVFSFYSQQELIDEMMSSS